MGGACNTHGRDEKQIQEEGRELLGGRITLMWIKRGAEGV
jgi:hypothetical protein